MAVVDLPVIPRGADHLHHEVVREAELAAQITLYTEETPDPGEVRIVGGFLQRRVHIGLSDSHLFSRDQAKHHPAHGIGKALIPPEERGARGSLLSTSGRIT